MGSEEPKPPCPKCGGRGWKTTSNLTVRKCSCLVQKMMAQFIGPELSRATPVPGLKGPLYAVDPKDFDAPATLDRTTDNLLIHTRWPVLASHLQLALGHRCTQDVSFSYLIDIDQHLLNVYLGNEHDRWKRTVKGFNSLKDLIEEPSLIIVRLGYIGHKNVAAANVLREVLMVREFVNRPTWIVKNPHAEYPISWDEMVAAVIRESFDTVDLARTDPNAAEPEPERQSPGMQVEEVTPPAPRAARAPRTSAVLEDPLYDGRENDRKSTWKTRKKHSGGEGGME